MLFEHQIQPGCLFCNPFSAEAVFGDLPPDVLASLASIKKRKTFPAAADVFSTGDTLRRIYIFLEGEAVITLYSRSTAGGSGGGGGDSFCSMRPAGRHEVFGLTETLAEAPCRMTLHTITPCDFEFIDARDFKGFLLKRAAAGFRLVQVLSLNLQKHCRLGSSKISCPLLLPPLQ